MKYMLLIYGNDRLWDVLDDETLASFMRTHETLCDELKAAGEFLDTNPLTVKGAKVVRTEDGVPTVTDGPFTEAKEVLAGYYLVDCASMDRAVEIAGRLDEAAYAPIEVREVTRFD